MCAADKEVTKKAICAVMNTLRALVKIRPEKKSAISLVRNLNP